MNPIYHQYYIRYSHHESNIEDHGGCIHIKLDIPIDEHRFKSDLLNFIIPYLSEYRVINILDQNEYEQQSKLFKEKFDEFYI